MKRYDKIAYLVKSDQKFLQPDGQFLANMRSQRDCSNENTPSDPSDYESDDNNFDDEIQVSSYERKITDN